MFCNVTVHIGCHDTCLSVRLQCGCQGTRGGVRVHMGCQGTREVSGYMWGFRVIF